MASPAIDNKREKRLPSICGISRAFTSISLKHLLEICLGDTVLASDILDTFCVQGRKRAESLRSAANRVDIDAVVCDAVRARILHPKRVTCD